MKLVMATNNRHKFEEVNQMLPAEYSLQSLQDIGCNDDIPETADTLEGNAALKSAYVKEHFGLDCFADDTGLEVDALDGAPGVYSARYAGEKASYQDNVDKLMQAMEGQSNRKARFRTVISLLLDGEEYFFEGVVEGVITPSAHGNDGFGYDPVFQPEGFDRTFAEMSMDEKAAISHRGRATAALIEFLKNYRASSSK